MISKAPNDQSSPSANRFGFESYSQFAFPSGASLASTHDFRLPSEFTMSTRLRSVIPEVFFAADHPFRKFISTTPIVIAHRGTNSTRTSLQDVAESLRQKGFCVEEIYYEPDISLEDLQKRLSELYDREPESIFFLNEDLFAGITWVQEELDSKEKRAWLPGVAGVSVVEREARRYVIDSRPESTKVLSAEHVNALRQLYNGEVSHAIDCRELWLSILKDKPILVERPDRSFYCARPKVFSIDQVLEPVRGQVLKKAIEQISGKAFSTSELSTRDWTIQFIALLGAQIHGQVSLDNIFIHQDMIGDHISGSRDELEYKKMAEDIKELLCSRGVPQQVVQIISGDKELAKALDKSLVSGSKNLYIFDRHAIEYDWQRLFWIKHDDTSPKASLDTVALNAGYEDSLDKVKAWCEGFKITSGAIIIPIDATERASLGQGFTGAYSKLLGPLNVFGEIEDSESFATITATDAINMTIFKSFWRTTFGSAGEKTHMRANYKIVPAIIRTAETGDFLPLKQICDELGFDLGHAESLVHGYNAYVTYKSFSNTYGRGGVHGKSPLY